MMYVIIALLVLIVILIIVNIRIVPQSQAYVIERLGAFSSVWQVGLHVKIPFLDRIANKMSLKEKVLDFEPLRHSLGSRGDEILQQLNG